MPERVTIKTIARDLGISHMTVSRALSGHPNVQKETRETVIKRARELGYVRNAAARAMRGDGTGIAGLLLPNIRNEFYARFANTMAQACEARGLQLIIHLTDDLPDVEARALDRLREVEARAVVMVPSPGGDEPAPPRSGAPGIIHLIRQTADKADGVPAILVEDGGAIRDAVVHLFGQGYRSIGYIGGPAELSSGGSRLAAFRRGLADAGLSEQPGTILTGPPGFEMGRELALELLAGGGVSAIVCGGFEISNGALSALMDTAEADRRSVGFVGYGDPSFYAWIDGGISTVQVPVDELAEHAVEMIFKQDGQEPAKPATFKASFVQRRSSGRR